MCFVCTISTCFYCTFCPYSVLCTLYILFLLIVASCSVVGNGVRRLVRKFISFLVIFIKNKVNFTN
jgi:hypothetical protein